MLSARLGASHFRGSPGMSGSTAVKCACQVRNNEKALEARIW